MSPKPRNPTGSDDQVVITLVRHGATEWNTERRLQGWADVPLSEQGRRQALALSTQLAHTVHVGVWSSDLRRAVETTRLLGQEPTPDVRLRELGFGSLEGSTWTDLDSATQAELIDFGEFTAPGGESVVAMQRRVAAFFDELNPGHHLVVTHAGPIRVALQACGLENHPGHCETAEINWTTKEVLHAESNAIIR